MKRLYSVLLFYPDYMQQNGDDTFYTFVKAESKARAIALARKEALAENDECENMDDFSVLLVLEGRQRAL